MCACACRHICEQSEGLCSITSVLLRHAIARRYLQPRLAQVPSDGVASVLNKLEMEERLRRTLLAHCEKDAKENAELGSRNTEREVLFQLWKLESFDELKGFVSEIGTLRKLCTSGASCDLLIHCVSVARTAWKVPIKIEWDALEYLAMASHGIDQTSVMHTVRSLLAVADVLHVLGEAAHGQAEVFYRAALGGWLGGDKAVCLAKLATVRLTAAAHRKAHRIQCKPWSVCLRCALRCTALRYTSFGLPTPSTVSVGEQLH